MKNILYYKTNHTDEIDEGVSIGRDTKIWHWTHVQSRAQIGEKCVLGQNVNVGPRVCIGNGVKIQNNVSVYEGVTLEDDVFVGPSVVFTNIINPRAFIRRMDEVRPTLVKQGASIGANATIICGVTIGEYAFVGAGAVVTRDVPAYGLVVGTPARLRKWICKCGYPLTKDDLQGDWMCTNKDCPFPVRYFKMGDCHIAPYDPDRQDTPLDDLEPEVA